MEDRGEADVGGEEESEDSQTGDNNQPSVRHRIIFIGSPVITVIC